MNNKYHQIGKDSLLYSIIEEMVFLKETRKISNHIVNLLKLVVVRIKAKYQSFIKNEWIRAYFILAGYMLFSTALLLAAYELVMIY